MGTIKEWRLSLQNQNKNAESFVSFERVSHQIDKCNRHAPFPLNHYSALGIAETISLQQMEK
jgi:hypothetical protein